MYTYPYMPNQSPPTSATSKVCENDLLLVFVRGMIIIGQVSHVIARALEIVLVSQLLCLLRDSGEPEKVAIRFGI